MKKATIRLDINKTIDKIDDRLYSSFIEHMGRAVYTGIYEPGHPSADEQGFRGDVKRLIRPLSLECIRYPGGNFVSGYNWEDGIGDKAQRPVRADLAWFALEPNQVGTDEFMYFAQEVGAKPMLAVNLGTGTPHAAANLLEYCNFPSGTYYSDLRRKNGHEKPYGIKLWCLGNEMDGPWQICAKTAEEYGRAAHETAKLMKWLDPSIELVACGSSFREMPTYGEWERTVLRHCYEDIDYLSLHQYYQNIDGDLPSFLSRSCDMAEFIREVAGICAQIKAEKHSDKDVRLSFDEWNVWYHFKHECAEPERWTVARPIEEELYDFADALLVGSMLTTLINNCDVVKIACLAQLVNTIAPIMTAPNGGAWIQTVYYPFQLCSRYLRGSALKANCELPSYECDARKNVPCADCAASVSEDGKTLSIFVVNKSLEDDLAVTLPLEGMNVKALNAAITLCAPLDAVNREDSSPVAPATLHGVSVHENAIEFTAKHCSLNLISVKLD